jgi:hypothetical protein
MWNSNLVGIVSILWVAMTWIHGYENQLQLNVG